MPRSAAGSRRDVNRPNTTHLLALARAGDSDALNHLLSTYAPRLERMIDLRLDTAQRRRFEPADVVQDALVDATRRFGEWCAQERYPFYVWLRLLAGQALAASMRHHMQAQMRDPGREQSLEGPSNSVSAQSAADWLMASQTSPTQAARRAEARTMVLAALNELEEVDRQILVLRNFEQLTNEEAAAELGIEPAAASKRFTRALQRMRPALRAFEEHESQP